MSRTKSSFEGYDVTPWLVTCCMLCMITVTWLHTHAHTYSSLQWPSNASIARCPHCRGRWVQYSSVVHVLVGPEEFLRVFDDLYPILLVPCFADPLSRKVGESLSLYKLMTRRIIELSTSEPLPIYPFHWTTGLQSTVVGVEYEWKGLWCSITVGLVSTQTWMSECEGLHLYTCTTYNVYSFVWYKVMVDS